MRTAQRGPPGRAIDPLEAPRSPLKPVGPARKVVDRVALGVRAKPGGGRRTAERAVGNPRPAQSSGASRSRAKGDPLRACADEDPLRACADDRSPARVRG